MRGALLLQQRVGFLILFLGRSHPLFRRGRLPHFKSMLESLDEHRVAVPLQPDELRVLLPLAALLHDPRDIGPEFAGEEPAVLVLVRGALQAVEERGHEEASSVLLLERLAFRGAGQELDGALFRLVLLGDAAFQRELLRRGDLPTRHRGIHDEHDMLGHDALGELLQQVERNDLVHVLPLGVPRDEIPEVLAVAILGDPGMAGEDDDEAVLPSDLPGQEVHENGVQPLEAGVLVIELDDFFESSCAQRVPDGLGVADGAGQLGRDQVLVDADDQPPGLVVEPVGPADLSRRRRRREEGAQEADADGGEQAGGTEPSRWEGECEAHTQLPACYRPLLSSVKA